MATVKSLKADVLSISPLSIALGKGLKHQLLDSLWWPIYIINSVDNTNLPCYTLLPKQHHSFFRNLPPLSSSVCISSWISSSVGSNTQLVSGRHRFKSCWGQNFFRLLFCSCLNCSSPVTIMALFHFNLQVNDIYFILNLMYMFYMM